MSLFRIAAILLIAAIANPLCCCYASAASPSASFEISKDAEGEGKQAQHNPDNCQHMAERDSLISQTAESGDSLVKIIHSPALDLPAFLAISELDAQTKSPVRAGSSSVPVPDTPLAQAYCVYLLWCEQRVEDEYRPFSQKTDPHGLARAMPPVRTPKRSAYLHRT